MNTNQTPKTYYSVAETAQFLRAALKQRFPGVTFSVRSKSYSGGASINVKWTDGPTSDEVKSVTNLYEGATFDGMIDLKSYHTAVVIDDNGPREVHFGADFIFENRHYSAEFLTRVYLFTCRKYGITPRENAVRDTSWGADLTNEAQNDGIGAEQHWRMGEMVRRETQKATVNKGFLIVAKR